MNSYQILILLFIIVSIYLVLKSRLQIVKNYNITPHPKAYRGTLPSTDMFQFNETPRKKQVYIYMSLDYPQLPEYGKYSVELMEKYCNMHGYNFQIFDHSSNSVMSPYWIRVNDLYLLLNKTPKNALIVYLDLDATIHPDFFNSRLETLVDILDLNTNNDWNMYAAIDPGIVNYEMNTGVIIAKNTDWTKSFVKTWLTNYPKAFWKKDLKSNKWSCSNKADTSLSLINSCLWAGDEYEQGMFNRLYQRDILDAQKHILPVDTSLFGNKDPKKKSFIIHLMGYNNKTRLKYFKEFSKGNVTPRGTLLR